MVRDGAACLHRGTHHEAPPGSGEHRIVGKNAHWGITTRCLPANLSWRSGFHNGEGVVKPTDGLTKRHAAGFTDNKS